MVICINSNTALNGCHTDNITVNGIYNHKTTIYGALYKFIINI